MPRRSFKTRQKQTGSKGYPLRMGQLLGPYSIGSIYPCDANTTIMIAGLDAFDTSKMNRVQDSRLERYIGVDQLFAPPANEGAGSGYVPAIRFPNWLYCPRCGRMRYVQPNDTSNAIYCDNPACQAKTKHKTKLVPERFVVVCPRGHIDSFPVMQWVHGGEDHDPGDSNHVITRWTLGGSTTMGDIVYTCSCGAKRSLAGATQHGGLNRIGYHCTGREPWLDRVSSTPCDSTNEDLRVVIMGATNVSYADTVSSVLIPDAVDEKTKGVIGEQYESLCDMESKGLLGAALDMLSTSSKIAKQSLLLAYRMRKTQPTKDISEDEYLHEEYLTLKEARGSSKGEFEASSVNHLAYDSLLINSYISRLTLVDTLTVTRALVGLSRLNPEANDGRPTRERRATLARNPRLDWTLAIQTIGEGIFIELNGDELSDWAKRPEVANRFAMMQENFDTALQRRNRELKQLNPKYVVLHTLSHLLMLSISKVCGYSAASLRERVYCEKYLEEGSELFDDMHGLLIYTASQSGDGSLGGLVRAGKPGRFEDVLNDALNEALWCSDDPVCIESTGQGLDSCNLAACFNCCLVPETACEIGNKFLDRGLVVGTLDVPTIGLFGAELREA